MSGPNVFEMLHEAYMKGRGHRPRGGPGEHGVDERAPGGRSARPWCRVRTA